MWASMLRMRLERYYIAALAALVLNHSACPRVLLGSDALSNPTCPPHTHLSNEQSFAGHNQYEMEYFRSTLRQEKSIKQRLNSSTVRKLSDGNENDDDDEVI